MIIVSASNDSYAQHLAVMLTSLLENSKHRGPIRIFVIDGNISSAHKKKLQRTLKIYGKKAAFLSLDKNLLDKLPATKESSYISQETYYRILIPDLLSSRIPKALYLDCDMIVQSDLFPLWKTKIKDYHLAAVNTRKNKRIKNEADYLRHPLYFNAGVLLMNLKRWRLEKTSRTIIEYMKNNPDKLKLMDQDALNAVLRNSCRMLHPTWNYTTILQRRLHIENPAIIHFTGHKKPWNSDHPYKKQYEKYLKASLWEQA